MGTVYLLLAFPGVGWSQYPLFHSGPGLILTGSQTWGMLLLYGILAFLHLDFAAPLPLATPPKELVYENELTP